MADARDFLNPELREDGGGERPGRHEERGPGLGPPPPSRDDLPPHEPRDLPPRFEFAGEDLLKLMDGLTQQTVLSGLPVQYEASPKLREAVGKIMDQMGFPEDLLPAAAFDPKGRWKILAGCVLAYAGLGVFQAVQQRKLAMALIKQQMDAQKAATAAQQAAADHEAKRAAPPKKEEVSDAGHPVADSTDGGHGPS